ncbi:MAG TPA: hypothetical protein VI756_02200 [Blastocatellia bacterium]
MLETIESGVPIAAAAKLLLGRFEERFARRTEYFRLQMIWMLSYLLALVLAQTHPQGLSLFPLSTPLFVSIALLFLGSFTWGLLAYKRSKVYFAKTKEKARLPSSLFCPHCGTESSLDASYCRCCRQDLGAVAQALRGRPSGLTKWLDDQIARADQGFSRMTTGRLIVLTAATLLMLVGMILVTVAELLLRNYTLALYFILLYLPFCLMHFQLLLVRRRERAVWNPDKARENTSRILEWLCGNQEGFEEQGVTEGFLTGAVVGLRSVEQTKAALDLLENREIVVRLPNKQEAIGVLVKPGRGWPRAKATVDLRSSHQPGSLTTQPMHVLDDPSVKTTAPLPNPTAKVG